MRTKTQDKTEGYLAQANYLRWKRDPLAQVEAALVDAGENPEEYTYQEKMSLYEEGFVGNVEL